jgi:hypothetical protein
VSQNHVGRRGQNVGHRGLNGFNAGRTEATVDPQALANVQAAREQSLLKRQHVELRLRVFLGHLHDDADAPQPARPAARAPRAATPPPRR